MAVILLTILISSCLAGIFIVCFAAEFARSRNGSPERDSLLPLDDAPPRPAAVATPSSSSPTTPS